MKPRKYCKLYIYFFLSSNYGNGAGFHWGLAPPLHFIMCCKYINFFKIMKNYFKLMKIVFYTYTVCIRYNGPAQSNAHPSVDIL
jgi:hypothetical protein